MTTVLLGALAAGGAVGGIALAKSISPAANPSVPAPSISSGPASPTISQSGSFVYTDSQAVSKFQCSLDNANFTDCGTTRPSSTSYSGLAAGSHTFQVRAVAATSMSQPTPYTWQIDRTPPQAQSINPADPFPTNAPGRQWQGTFPQ